MIPPALLAQALRASAPFPGGPAFTILCQAIATAVVTWLPTGVQLVGVTTGVVGVGTVTGTLFFAGTPAIVLGAIGGTLRGPTAPLLATVLSVGLTTGLAGQTYLGVSAGVGLGTDLSRVIVANPVALAQTLRGVHTSLCASQGGTGSVVPGYYEALAGAIAGVVMTGGTLPPTGVVAPTSPLGPSSSVGTSIAIPV